MTPFRSDLAALVALVLVTACSSDSGQSDGGSGVDRYPASEPHVDASSEVVIDAASEGHTLDSGLDRADGASHVPASADAGDDATVGAGDASVACREGHLEERTCGTTDSGRQTRTCQQGHWSEWTICEESTCGHGASEQRPCGQNGRGTQTRSCELGDWMAFGDCVDPDECTDGDQSEQACPGVTQSAQRSCTNGHWTAWSSCATSCDPGDDESRPCGFNGRGSQQRTCTTAGVWSAFGSCVDPDVCSDGAKSATSCGLNDRGIQELTCSAGQWGTSGACADPDVCTDGTSETRACGFNDRGLQRSFCTLGQYGAWSTCADPDVCKDGEVTSLACGPNGRGTQQRTCLTGRFTLSACADPDTCKDGDSVTLACGFNGRGSQPATCVAGSPLPTGSCVDPDVCRDGARETRTRYATASVPAGALCQSESQTRRCASGAWGGWSGSYAHDTCVYECGNRRLDGVETCDDGNAMGGDGCSSRCTMEAGHACPLDTLGRSVCTACVVLADAAASGAAADGTTWPKAFATLSPALAAAVKLIQDGLCTSAQVWVARGVYHPGNVGERDASFRLGSTVQLYGGFQRGDVYRSQRNVDPTTTVLSGDLARDDARTGSKTDNSRNVVVAVSSSLVARIDGFTIRGGYDDDSTADGAGLLALGTLTLANVLFTDNVAFGAGGGASFRYSGAWLEDVRFARNVSHDSGGGMYVGVHDGTLVMRNVSFEANRAAESGGGFWAGSPCDIEGLELLGNVTEEAGGGAVLGGNAPSRIDRAYVRANDAQRSGGVLFTTDGEISNSLFFENEADIWGGALDVRFSYVTATNLTIFDNESRSNEGGGVYVYGNQVSPARVTLRNSIVWGNVGGQTFGTVARSEHNCIQGVTSTATVRGDCNVGATPFVNPLAGDFELASGSNAIDFGDESFVTAGGVDLAERARIVGASVDLGAYERP